MIRACEAEVRRDFAHADRRAILEYVLRNPSERRRLGFGSDLLVASGGGGGGGGAAPLSPRAAAAAAAAADALLSDACERGLVRLLAEARAGQPPAPVDESLTSLAPRRSTLVVPLPQGCGAAPEVQELAALGAAEAAAAAAAAASPPHGAHHHHSHHRHPHPHHHPCSLHGSSHDSDDGHPRSDSGGGAAEADSSSSSGSSSGGGAEAVVFSVQWDAPRAVLAGEPRLPRLLWLRPRSGISPGTIAAVSALLLPVLATPAAVLRHLASTWHDVVSRGALLLTLPGSHADALRQSWRAVEPELFLLTQVGMGVEGGVVIACLLPPPHCRAATATESDRRC